MPIQRENLNFIAIQELRSDPRGWIVTSLGGQLGGQVFSFGISDSATRLAMHLLSSSRAPDGLRLLLACTDECESPRR